MASSPFERIVSASERFYRLLLLSYPKDFRQVYCREMAQTFRDCCREALQNNGKWGVMRLWGFVLYDLATTALIEHIRTFITNLKRFFVKDATMLMAIEGREIITLGKPFNLNVAQRTDIGRQRKTNEDSMTSIIPGDAQVLAKKGALFIVADGLGGHVRGNFASEMAVSSLSNSYYQDEHDEIGVSLQQAMKQANTIIYQANESENPPLTEDKIMGTTCVAAVLQGDTVYVANVGDSRVYIVRNGQVKQISEDHSIVAEQIRAGLITKDQARGHPQHNIITRCLGTQSDVEVDIFSEQVQEGDSLVLCTDGLSNEVNEEELRAIVDGFEPQESVLRLVERANEQGGPDNITAIVARVSLEEHE